MSRQPFRKLNFLRRWKSAEGGLTVNVTPLLLAVGLKQSTSPPRDAATIAPPASGSRKVIAVFFFFPPPPQRQTQRKEGTLSQSIGFRKKKPMATQKNRAQLPNVVTGLKCSPAPQNTVTATLSPSFNRQVLLGGGGGEGRGGGGTLNSTGE